MGPYGRARRSPDPKELCRGMTHTIKDLLGKTQVFFADKGIDTPRLDAELLLAHVLKAKRLELYMDMDRPLQSAEVDAYRELVRRRAQREPVAYITGRREFYGRDLEVSPAVLVPRPDTETLVDRVLELLPDDAEGTVVDVGTGSGCIAIALAAERPGLRVIGVDLSDDALEVAGRNVERHALGDRVTLRQGDLLGPVEERELVAVVGNPPYIKRSAAVDLMPDVKDHEPELALFGEGDDGLEHHRRILAAAAERLGPSGFVALEIGFDQASPARALGAPGFGSPEVFADLGGQPRVVLWQKAAATA
jgi:release factor glutamine methyltransferase